MASATAALKGLPPGPAGRPMVGNLLDYSRDPLGFLTRCSREYGDVARLRFPGPPAYLISHPDHIEHVLVKNNRNFIKDRYTRAELRILGNGLLVNEGDFWRRQRRLAQPAFHRRRVEAYGETMVSYTDRMTGGWRHGEARDVHREMMRLTLEIVTKTLIDADLSSEAEGVGESLGVIMDRSSDQGSGVFWRMIPESIPTPGNVRYRRATRRLDGIIHAIVDERRQSGADTGDPLSMLLHAEDEVGNRMSDRQLRDEVMTIILAGHETTAIALSWTWYLLGNHPEAEAKLTAELDEVRDGRAPTVEDLPRLPYADAVIKESMRLYPPAWGRRSRGHRRLRDRGLPRPRRDPDVHKPVRDAPGPPPLRRPGDLRPRPLARRTDERPARVRLLPLRRRPQAVHRQRLREDGGRAVARGGGPQVHPRTGPGAHPRPPTLDHAASQRRDLDDLQRAITRRKVEP